MRRLILLGAGLWLVAVPCKAGANDLLSDALPEVSASAERRPQSLQETPMSVTAISGEELDSSGIGNSVDLQLRVPELVVSTNTAFGHPYLRGVGTDITGIGADPSIAFYMDDVYQPRAVDAIQDLYDVERVEILKGPQGTLYGRNATGGAIHFRSKPPERGTSVWGDLLYGEYNEVRTRAGFNLPLMDGRAYTRIAFLRKRRDGFTDNPIGDDLDDADLWSTRAQLLLLPSDRVEILLGGDYSDENSSRNIAPKVDTRYPSVSVDVLGASVPSDPRTVKLNYHTSANVTKWGLSSRIAVDLGEAVLRSVTAYRYSELDEGIDIDGTEVDFARNDPDEESKAYSQEIELTSKGGGELEWLLGGYYFWEDATQDYRIGLPMVPLLIQPSAKNETTAYAAFGQISRRLSSKLRATVGLRYSYEDKDHSIDSSTNGLPTASSDGSDDWDAWTPRFVVQYVFNENMMLYASASRGFKSGGFNSNAIQTPQDFDPEFIWSYELGLKSMLFDDRLRVNLVGFWYDYDDLQVVRWDGSVATVLNAAEARGRGFEAEIVTRPLQGFQTRTSLSLLDAEFTDFSTSNPDASDPDALQDLSGNTLPRAPEVAFYGAAHYTRRIANYGYATLLGEYTYKSKIYFDAFNAKGVSQNPYEIWNARLSFESADGRWHAALFGKNLTDEVYKNNVVRNSALIGTLQLFGPPRTFGVEAGMRF